MKALCPGQHLPYYKSMGKCFDAQGQVTNRIVRPCPNSNFAEILYLTSGCPDYLQVWWRCNQKWRRYRLDNIYKSVGDIGCRGNQSSDPICPKTLCSLIAPDKDLSTLSKYPPIFRWIGYQHFQLGIIVYYRNFQLGISEFSIGYPSRN